MTRPISVVTLHALGSSRRAFDAVTAFLGDGVEVVGIDLPGFGEAPALADPGVAATLAHVEEHLRVLDLQRWMLVGHSMGAKIAAALAAAARDGNGIPAPAAMLLLAGSPPGPEPMAEERRDRMTAWAEDGPLDEAAVQEFLDATTGAPLSPAAHALARADLLRTSPAAWTAWLQHGSREDWSQRVGVLDAPALLLAGAADGDDLGAAAQRRLNLPHHRRGSVVELEGAGHLLPLERPAEVAAAITSLAVGHQGDRA